MVCLLSLPAVIDLNSGSLICATETKIAAVGKSFSLTRDCGNLTAYCSLPAMWMPSLVPVFEVSLTCCKDNLRKMSWRKLRNACNSYQRSKGLSE